jgi:hypothetical protein
MRKPRSAAWIVALSVALAGCGGDGTTASGSGLTGDPSLPTGGTGPASPSVTAGACANPYLPVSTGAAWTYDLHSSASADATYTDTITAVTSDGYSVTSSFADLTKVIPWSCTSEGLVALQYANAPGTISNGGIEFSVKTTRVVGVTFPASIAPGDRWTQGYGLLAKLVSSQGSGNGKGSVSTNYRALRKVDVVVPAGTFSALKVRFSGTYLFTITVAGLSVPANHTFSGFLWLVQDVGVVKTSVTVNGTFSLTATTELASGGP